MMLAMMSGQRTLARPGMTGTCELCGTSVHRQVRTHQRLALGARNPR